MTLQDIRNDQHKLLFKFSINVRLMNAGIVRSFRQFINCDQPIWRVSTDSKHIVNSRVLLNRSVILNQKELIKYGTISYRDFNWYADYPRRKKISNLKRYIV